MQAARIFLGIGVLLIISAAWFFTHVTKSSPTLLKSSGTLGAMMELTSPAFKNGQSIPPQYTCDGEGKNPPLEISGVPPLTKTLALIVEDPDVPKALLPQGVFVHWVLFDIPSTTTKIEAGDSVGVSGNNGASKGGYTGPCPPPQYEPKEHRYIFTLYALDEEVPLPSGVGADALKTAIEGHVLEEAELIGLYERQDMPPTE